MKIKTISLLASKVLAVSAFKVKALVDSGLNEKKCLVFPNPYQFSEQKNSPDKEGLLRSLLNIEREAPFQCPWIWIHVANLRKVKDQQTLLQGFAGARTRTTHPQKLLIVGDGPERANLEVLCRTMGIAEDVHFLGFQQDVEKLLAVSDGFMLSSISEAMLMSILEASDAGLLLVSSAVGGVPELIRDGETGYMFPFKNHSRLAEIIDLATTQPDKSRQMALAAQEGLREKTDLPRVIKRIVEIYKGLN